jgi:uncharacterized membrane protein YraQ (UPF0718 family)
MLSALFWGGLLRSGQALLAGAPTLLVGLVVAGVLRCLVGPAGIRRAFGGTTWRSLPMAWMWGMLLPVCSLGVIPVACELRRARLSGGTILAFALTAPLFNPLSLLYGLTLSSPGVILCFAAASLLVVTLVGVVWDRLFPDTVLATDDPLPIPPGLARMAAVATVGARHLASPVLAYSALGLAGSILLVALFPYGSLTDSMGHNDPWAPCQMLAVAIPAYATPLQAMMQVGGMFVHGNSVGAAFVLLALGTGANLGLLAWAWHAYGFRRAATFLGLFVAVVMAIAYAIEQPLYSAGNVDRPHTHAFDCYACPYAPSSSNLPARTWSTLRDDARPYETIALGCCALLGAAGAVLRVKDPQGGWERFLALAPPPATEKRLWNRQVPGPVLGGVGLAGLVALSIVGCYAYYPPPEQTLEDLQIVHADALTAAMSKQAEQAVASLKIYDDLTRKLQVGYYLRHYHVDEFQQLRAKVLRGRLEQLKDLVEEGRFDAVRAMNRRVSDAFRRCREAFRS